MNTRIVRDSYFVENDLLEPLAEVPATDSEAWDEGKTFNCIGKYIPRIDGYDKVSGSALYTFDISLPRLAHARTLRSPHAHARIVSIDKTPALAIPGVLAVITHEDIPKIPWYSARSALFDTVVRYIGDEVACVAAETEAIALQAAEAINVKYEPLPFVTHADESLKDTAPKIYPNGNIVSRDNVTYSRGDIEKGFADADAIVENTLKTQVAVHNPTEVHCSVVQWDGGDLTVWDSTQNVFGVRDDVARLLGLASAKVRVIKKYMGGGFGSKLATGKYTVMAAILARKTGRPVRIALDRREMNLAVGNRPDSRQTIKIGVKKDGVITAMSLNSFGAVGAYPGSAGLSWPFKQIYNCPNVRTEEYSIFVNAGPSRPMRAPGHVQGTFALESMIEMAADKINMDPLEFRLKNYAPTDPALGAPYTSKYLKEAYIMGAEAFGWKNRRPTGSSSGPLRRGMGMASQIWWGGGGPPAHAVLMLNADGSARVLSGTQDLGTGTYTFMAQIVAEVLEIPIHKISVVIGDTGVCPVAPLSGGSLTAPSVSPAVRDAALQMKKKLLSGAAVLLNTPENRLTFKNGAIFPDQDESKKLTCSDIISKLQERVLVTTGSRNANPEKMAACTFGAQFAEVEVDIFTGRIRVLRITAAHDIGRILNPLTMENQFHGGIIQGVGFALMEERIMDPYTGRVLNANFHDYRVPTMMDIPEITVLAVDKPDIQLSGTGVKGCGEPAHIPTAAAIANAVYNALGTPVGSLPMTPDKVLSVISPAVPELRSES